MGRLLLGVMNLSVRVSCICVTSTLTTCFHFFSEDTIRSQSHLYMFVVFIWQQSFMGTRAYVSFKNVCISLGISSATAASHEIFHLLDGAHQFRQLSATESPSTDFVLVPLCTGSTFHAACAISGSHDHLLLTWQCRGFPLQ